MSNHFSFFLELDLEFLREGFNVGEVEAVRVLQVLSFETVSEVKVDVGDS